MSRKNEGSIYQTKDGSWRGAICLGWVNGKPKRKTVKRATRSEVALAIRNLLTQRDKNRPLSTKRRSVEQFLNEWLTVHIQPNLAPLTFEGYELMVRNHLVPALGKLQLDQLTGSQVQLCLNACTEKGLSSKSVKNINNALKSALSTAVSWQYVDRNVAKDARPPKQKGKFQAKPLTVEQAERLISWLAATEHPLEAVFVLALMTGLRKGEVLGLQWSDIDLARATMTVQHNSQAQKGKGMILTTVKSAGSLATVPLPSLAIGALARRRVAQERERAAAGESWQADLDFVFTKPNGKRLGDNPLLIELHRVLALLDLPQVRLHDLRHTTASLLLAKRVPMKVIQTIMRHASFNITMEIYAHLVPSELTQTASMMDAMFQKADATQIATQVERRRLQ